MMLDHFIDAKIKIFRSLQRELDSFIFLIHFSSNRRLYIYLNAFKQWEFAIMMYHVLDDLDDNYSRISMQLIMYLSRMLNVVEQNYWSIELEIVDIVWVIKKIRHMIEFTRKSFIIIYIDHFVAISISRQTSLTTSSIDKSNLRLVRASQYLFSFNLTLRHKVEKFNVVSDALSRLFEYRASMIDDKDKNDILNALYDHSIDIDNIELNETIILEKVTVTYHIILIQMSNKFKTRLSEVYMIDKHWAEVYDMIKSFEIESFSNDFDESLDIRFTYRDDLIYFKIDDEQERLYIFASMKQKIFKLAHDNASHDDFHRIYDRIANSVYIRQLIKRLRQYIAHCLDCQINQTRQHTSYDSLQSMLTSTIFFHTIIIDFVVALSLVSSKNLNSILSVTNKFFKRVLIISDKDTHSAMNWVNILITELLSHDWGISRSIISDRDSKFMFDFWQIIFRKLKIDLLTSIAYHSQTNDQSKRTNQIVKIALRFWLS